MGRSAGLALILLIVAFLAPFAGGARAGSVDGLFPPGVKVGYALKFADLPKRARGHRPMLRLDHKGRPTVLLGRTLFVIDGTDALPLPIASDDPVDDFTWTGDGALIAIRGDRLGFPGPGGVADLTSLPSRDMRLAPAGRDRLYIYGGATRDQRRQAYLLEKGEGLMHLAEMPYPITAVAGDGTKTFVAIGRSVLFLAPEKSVRLVYRPTTEIRHLAYAPPHGLFYATRRAVGFVAAPGRGFTFLRAGGVQPLVHGEDLYLLIPLVGILRASPVSAFEAMAKRLTDGGGEAPGK